MEGAFNIYQWLLKYPWLKFSKQDNGGYCHPCVLFSRSDNFRSDPGVLVKTPLTKFKKALELFDKHQAKSYHRAFEYGLMNLQGSW